MNVIPYHWNLQEKVDLYADPMEDANRMRMAKT